MIFTQEKIKWSGNNSCVQEYQEFCKRGGLNLVVYTEFARNHLINQQPDIFMAFLIQKYLEGLSIMVSFQLLCYNLTSFLINNQDMEGEDGEEGDVQFGEDENFDDFD